MFKKKTKVYAFDEYPSGVCVKANTDYWYVQGKYKRKIPTLRIVESWSFPFVLKVTEESLSNLVTAKPLGFRDGTIVKAMDSTIYLISDRQKRKITTPDFLEAAGKFKSEISLVSNAELSLHELGKDLT